MWRRWQSLPEYAAGLSEADYHSMLWPSHEAEPRQVWVHVVQTRVKKLDRCQVLLVKEARDAPEKDDPQVLVLAWVAFCFDVERHKYPP